MTKFKNHQNNAKCLALLFAAFICLAPGARGAGSLVTATVTITNTAGTTNGQTITVNGDVRTWTNNVVLPSIQVLTNANSNGAATNLFLQIANNPFSSINLTMTATNAIALRGFPNQTITVSLSAGWATVTYLTNSLIASMIVRVPISIEASGQDTNIASLLATALDLSTNALSYVDILLSNYMSLQATQQVGGLKTFTNTSNLYLGGTFHDPIIQNGTNNGNAFTSPGTGTGSEQFGQGAQSTNTDSLAVGNGALAAGIKSTAVGFGAYALSTQSTALGYLSEAENASDTALGYGSFAAGTNSTAIGQGALVPNADFNSTAVGYNSACTAPNQIMLGSAGVSAVVNNYLSVQGGATFGAGVTNLQTTGTNTFLGGADVAFSRYALSTLANGNNAGVAVGTNVFVEVSGPTGAFTINGINGQPNRDGKFLILLNRTGQNMTIANDSGVEPTAANRIYCLTGADKVLTGNSAAMLIYNGNATHWICLSLTQ
ncbi:MAG TPA: hypothetical protein VG028_13450 [Terriglobia bacterium]|nr:hypothetical protein [Terriglobia bacterium]